MKIFIICSVRGMSKEYRSKLETYVAGLESAGHIIHLPHRDTDQSKTGLEICTQNAKAIVGSDEIHIFYNPASQGTHFDMGVAFACGKKIVVVEIVECEKEKSFGGMITEWAAGRQQLK